MIPVNETTPDIERARTEEMARIERRFLDVEPVSYTHLTLPTILLV